ncbi:hypothetical protein Emed_006478 [Eimeria media]
MPSSQRSPLLVPLMLWQQPYGPAGAPPAEARLHKAASTLPTGDGCCSMGRRSLWLGGPKAGQVSKGSSKDQELKRQSGGLCAAGFSEAEGVLLIPMICEASPNLAAFARQGNIGLRATAETPITDCREVPGVPGAEPVECCIFKLPPSVSDSTLEVEGFSADKGQAPSRSHKRLKRLNSTRLNQVGAVKTPQRPVRQRERQDRGLVLQRQGRSKHAALSKRQQPHVAPGLPSTRAARSAEARRPDPRHQEKAAPSPPRGCSSLQQHTSRRCTRTRKAPSSTYLSTVYPPPTGQQLSAAKVKGTRGRAARLWSSGRIPRCHREPVHALLRRLTQRRILQGLPPPLFCSCLSLPAPSPPSPTTHKGPVSASLPAKGCTLPSLAPRTPVLKPHPKATPQLEDGGRGPTTTVHAQRRLNAYLQAVADTQSGHAVYVQIARGEEGICPHD